MSDSDLTLPPTWPSSRIETALAAQNWDEFRSLKAGEEMEQVHAYIKAKHPFINDTPPPLPAGWTVERMNAALDSDDLSQSLSFLDSLPEEESRLFMEYISARNEPMIKVSTAAYEGQQEARKAEINASRVASGMPTLEKEEQEIVEWAGLTNAQCDLYDVAKVFQGPRTWGHVVVRAWYGNDEKWERYREAITAKFAADLKICGAVEDLTKGLAGGWKLIWIEDAESFGVEMTKAMRVIAARRLCNDKFDAGEVPDGIEDESFFMVDEKAVDSLFRNEREEGQDDGEGDAQLSMPYLTTVMREQPDPEEIPVAPVTPCIAGGYWKTARRCIIPELWKMLCIVGHIMELSAPDGEIWDGLDCLHDPNPSEIDLEAYQDDDGDGNDDGDGDRDGNDEDDDDEDDDEEDDDEENDGDADAMTQPSSKKRRYSVTEAGTDVEVVEKQVKKVDAR